MKSTSPLVALAVATGIALGFYPVASYANTQPQPQIATHDYLFTLTYEDAEKAVSEALAEKGAGSKVAAIITNTKGDSLYSDNRPVHVEIRGLRFDANAKSWSANLMFVGEANDVFSAKPIAGRYEELTEIPVLKRAIKNGDIISQQDIEMRDMPISRVRAGTVHAMSDLVGKTAIRLISQNRAIRDTEISEPLVVEKNAIVQIRYATHGIDISTSGQAMSSGSLGSIINVRNLTSNKLVRAVVESSGVVNVVTLDSQARNTFNGAQAYETN